MRADNIRPYATMLNSQTNPNLSNITKAALLQGGFVDILISI